MFEYKLDYIAVHKLANRIAYEARMGIYQHPLSKYLKVKIDEKKYIKGVSNKELANYIEDWIIDTYPDVEIDYGFSRNTYTKFRLAKGFILNCVKPKEVGKSKKLLESMGSDRYLYTGNMVNVRKCECGGNIARGFEVQSIENPSKIKYLGCTCIQRFDKEIASQVKEDIKSKKDLLKSHAKTLLKDCALGKELNDIWVRPILKNREKARKAKLSFLRYIRYLREYHYITNEGYVAYYQWSKQFITGVK